MLEPSRHRRVNADRRTAIPYLEAELVEVRLLGPLEVLDDHGQPLTVRAQRPKATLAVLALHPGQLVTTAQLATALWGAHLPGTAKESIHVFIHQLRKALGQDAIRTKNASYQLQVPPEHIDIVQFRRLVDQAHMAFTRGELDVAWEGFGQALALWRGPALADFTTEPFAHSEQTRLEERRLAAVEARLRVGLALGRHAQLVGELEALVAEQPLREGLWELLMLARYRVGRQAEALAAYQKARQQLVAQGLTPGEPLQRLERAILHQDPALDLPPPPQPQREPRSVSEVASPAPPAASVIPPVAAPVRVREHRKTVTVLVVGAGAGLAGDPEDARAQFAELTRQTAELVGRYGGVVRAGAMGRLLVVFGADRSHEDDPERAVRAALDLRAHIQTIGGPVKAGIATGQAVVTVTDPTGHATAAGDHHAEVVGEGEVVRMAARLEDTAPPGRVLVGAQTYLATSQAITYRPAPRLADDDATTPGVWEALTPRARTGAFRPTIHDPTPAPLVERDRELAILRDVLARLLHDRQPQLLTAVSEPGLGKTRLVAELGRLVDQAPDLVTWRAGRSVAYGGGRLGALAEIIKAHAGILDTDPAEHALHKLDQAITGVIDDPDTAVWTAAQLRALIGLSDPQAQTKTTAQERSAGWVRFLSAAAAKRPMVVVFEDLHWAEDALVDFIDTLIEQAETVPLLVVCTARLEFLDRRPRWGGGKPNSVTLSLSPLSPQGTEQLLNALLQDGVDLSRDARRALLAAASGNPLYVEEYVRMLTEGQAGDGALTAADVAVPVPVTIQQLIAARLDTLAPDDKLLLQDAAVLGEVGWVGALAAMSDHDRSRVYAGLQRLERRNFLRRLRESSVAAETEYAFRHTLIRDVAYGQLLRAERADKHQQAARWIETLNPDPGERVELLAHHYRQALALRRAGGQPAGGELADRARRAFYAAGNHARMLGSLADAASFYAAALDLWPAEDPQRPELLLRLGHARVYSQHTGGDLLQEARAAFQRAGETDRVAEIDGLLAQLSRMHGNADAARTHLEQALAAGQTPTPATVSARMYESVDLLTMDRNEEAIRVGREAVRMAVALGSQELEGGAIGVVGQARVNLGDLAGLQDMERAVTLMERHRHHMAGLARYGIAWSMWWYGDLERCAASIASGREAVARYNPAMLRWLDAVHAGLDYVNGDWDAVAAFAEEFLGSYAQGQLRYLEPWCRTLRARVRLGRDDPAAALEDTKIALDLTEPARDTRSRHAALAVQIRALLATGNRCEAASQLDALLAEQHKDPAQACATVDLGAALVELDYPPDTLATELTPSRWHQAVTAMARRDLDQAARMLAAIGAHADRAWVQLQLAEQLHTQQPTLARAELAQALTVFASAAATAYLRRGHELLAQLPDNHGTAHARPMDGASGR